VALAELIKWWDARDVLTGTFVEVDIDRGLRMARECRHHDAEWLCALFPPGVSVTQRQVLDVMLQQGEDVRALFLSHELRENNSRESEALLVRVAEMGYAPAQAVLSHGSTREVAMKFAQSAANQGDRCGICCLARCFEQGWGCAADEKRTIELYKAAAELGYAPAQFWYATSLSGRETGSGFCGGHVRRRVDA
jgi:hypothetical protein